MTKTQAQASVDVLHKILERMKKPRAVKPRFIYADGGHVIHKLPARRGKGRIPTPREIQIPVIRKIMINRGYTEEQLKAMRKRNDSAECVRRRKQRHKLGLPTRTPIKEAAE